MKILITLCTAAILFSAFKTIEPPGSHRSSGIIPATMAINGYQTDAEIRQAIDSINLFLEQYGASQSRLSVNLTGTVIITNANRQFFSFNLLDLDANERGIKMVNCDEKTHAPASWINFLTPTRKVAFIRLECIEQAELSRIHGLILALRERVMEKMFV